MDLFAFGLRSGVMTQAASDILAWQVAHPNSATTMGGKAQSHPRLIFVAVNVSSRTDSGCPGSVRSDPGKHAPDPATNKLFPDP